MRGEGGEGGDGREGAWCGEEEGGGPGAGREGGGRGEVVQLGREATGNKLAAIESLSRLPVSVRGEGVRGGG